MTREEALETLKEYLCFMCAFGSQNMMSCDIKYCDNREAIKALEQEPCKDVVSRKYVAEFLRNHAEDFEDTRVRMAFMAASSLVENTNNVPSVTPVHIEQEPVLDKIRAEIASLSPKPTAYDVVDGNPIKNAVWETLADVLQIIDKYKTEESEK